MTFGETVTRLRRGPSTSVDRYNNPIPGPVVETDIPGAAVDPGGSKEPVEVGRAAVVTTPKLYFRSTPDLRAGDEVKARGVLYEVEGNPALWRSPFNPDLQGVVVELKVVEG